MLRIDLARQPTQWKVDCWLLFAWTVHKCTHTIKAYLAIALLYIPMLAVNLKINGS